MDGKNFVVSNFAIVAAAFLNESIVYMLPWLMVMCCVVMTDLMFGVRKCMLMGEEIKLSRMIRDTMSKMVVYFAFVCMVAMIDVAKGGERNVETWACLIVCAVEGVSIVRNWLKPKGYDVNFVRMVSLLWRKTLHLEKEDTEGILTKRRKKVRRKEDEK